MEFSIVFNKISELFILILVGFFLSKKKVIDGKITKGFSDLILKITLPSMIIVSMQKGFSKELLKSSGKLVIIALIIYFICFVMAMIIPKLFKDKSRYGNYEFAIMFSNVGFMGYPIVNAVLGKEALFYTAIYNLPFNFLVFTLGIVMIGSKKNNKVDLKMFLNPGIISVLIGFLFFIFSIKLPSALYGTMDMLGNTTTPLSMIVIGSLLSKVDIKKIFADIDVYIISIIRLIIIPLMVYFGMKPFVKDELLLAIPVLIAAMPVAANAAILAEEYEGDAATASQIVFISTLLSLITIPIIVKYLIV